MAATVNSIANELLSLVSTFSYCQIICYLTTDDFVMMRTFQKLDLGRMFTIDKKCCYKNGELNNSQLFDSFGKFSDEVAESVRSDAIERIESGKQVYTVVGQEFFELTGWDFQNWAMCMCSSYYYRDEHLLFVLCHVFHRHALVICYDSCWSTLENGESMSVDELLDACDLHFVYLRLGIFGELHLKRR